MLSATWTLPICCFAELSCEFLSEVLRLPMCTIAPDDLLGALEGVAFGCIVADADILKTLGVFRARPQGPIIGGSCVTRLVSRQRGKPGPID
ncbi:hypothetical protein ACVWWO_007008 [Bradyrhizobium sp. F1.13.1]